MPDELDPQNPPADGGPDDGQLETAPETPAPSEAPADDPTAKRISELEQREKELQRRLRQQGNELARFKQQQSTAAPAETPIDPESWFSDPANATKRVVSSVLTEFEQRQEQKRQQERTLARLARERNMTPEDLQEEYENLMTASDDPEALVDILAAIRRARDTDSHIQSAAQTVRDSTIRNARAVSAQGGASPTPDPGPMTEEQFRQLSTKEQRAYIERHIGVGEWKY